MGVKGSCVSDNRYFRGEFLRGLTQHTIILRDVVGEGLKCLSLQSSGCFLIGTLCHADITC